MSGVFSLKFLDLNSSASVILAAEFEDFRSRQLTRWQCCADGTEEAPDIQLTVPFQCLFVDFAGYCCGFDVAWTQYSAVAIQTMVFEGVLGTESVDVVCCCRQSSLVAVEQRMPRPRGRWTVGEFHFRSTTSTHFTLQRTMILADDKIGRMESLYTQRLSRAPEV